MEPKFQSSFIPKGPVASNVSSVAGMGGAPVVRRKSTDLFSFLAVSIFMLSVVFAAGVFFYKIFLNYRIAQMKGQLEEVRAALDPETINELIRLNARIVSAEKLIDEHRVLSPFFTFLETATPKSVRYTSFNFNLTNKGPELVLEGQARSYAALASAAEALNRSTQYITNPVFSALSLDERGNVIFRVEAMMVPEALSYEDFVGNAPRVPESSTPATTTTATSSPR